MVIVTFFSAGISGYWAFSNQAEGTILSNFLDNDKPLVPKWFLLMTNTFSLLQLSAVGVAGRTLIGIKDLLPAYLDPRVTNLDLLTGISFASTGIGIDDLTATIFNVAHMSTQLCYFKQCLAWMQSTIGREAANLIVEDALFAISAGTNDMIFNLYDLPTRRGQFSLPAYHDFLLQNLESFVMILYSMGARRFSILGLSPIWCLSVQHTVGSIPPMPGGHLLRRACNAEENKDSQMYNAKLQALVLKLQDTLPSSRFAYVDIYNPLLDMITNPRKYVINVPNISHSLPINLSHDNYLPWRAQMIPVLRTHKLLGLVEGTMQDPPTHIDGLDGQRVMNPEYDNWVQLD
ncbi:PREDICTED: GDSL esterase/lipase At2g40250-like [Nelumbo nucifera]|uniref:GDSL esterase/lipase At2g40250-like n=1 Tax=Nelumbo nucifera TaxID=4432 RepID=A0A1U7ZVF2_NELNU|nr:PREDICTED: GDSL esterase/lipase At2g40250-like [Nelumbo nucifera]